MKTVPIPLAKQLMHSTESSKTTICPALDFSMSPGLLAQLGTSGTPLDSPTVSHASGALIHDPKV